MATITIFICPLLDRIPSSISTSTLPLFLIFWSFLFLRVQTRHSKLCCLPLFFSFCDIIHKRLSYASKQANKQPAYSVASDIHGADI
ncbi:hypothetical protein J3F84DRAFT_33640 [Trichoderma pleuroticola]